MRYVINTIEHHMCVCVCVLEQQIYFKLKCLNELIGNRPLASGYFDSLISTLVVPFLWLRPI